MCFQLPTHCVSSLRAGSASHRRHLARTEGAVVQCLTATETHPLLYLILTCLFVYFQLPTHDVSSLWAGSATYRRHLARTEGGVVQCLTATETHPLLYLILTCLFVYFQLPTHDVSSLWAGSATYRRHLARTEGGVVQCLTATETHPLLYLILNCLFVYFQLPTHCVSSLRAGSASHRRHLARTEGGVVQCPTATETHPLLYLILTCLFVYFQLPTHCVSSIRAGSASHRRHLARTEGGVV